MGLLDKRNITKAKNLALKNKEKIADGVNKATDAIDKKTGGKYADKLKKLDDAADKFAGKPVVDHEDAPTDAPADAPVAAPADGSPADDSTS